jgi:hypothetical protein
MCGLLHRRMRQVDDHSSKTCSGAYAMPMLQVFAMLVELRIGDVAGFDLSVMDAYRWHPHLERVDLSKCVSVEKKGLTPAGA